MLDETVPSDDGRPFVLFDATGAPFQPVRNFNRTTGVSAFRIKPRGAGNRADEAIETEDIVDVARAMLVDGLASRVKAIAGGTVTYLRDETGNRRFWPVRCGTIDIAALARDRDQLWAEAVARFRAGAIWWLDTPELLAEAAAEQDKRYQSDAWDDLISHWLTHETRTAAGEYPSYGAPVSETVPRAVPLADVSIGQILDEVIGIEPGRWTRGDQMRVGAYLKAQGWERYREPRGAADDAPREWRYRRKPGDAATAGVPAGG